MRIILGLLMLLCLTIVSLPANAQAVTVGPNCTIAWAANTEPDLAKYTVSGTLVPLAGGVGLTKTLDVPKPPITAATVSTTCAALGLQTGGTLSVQVEAVDLLNNRSVKSVLVTAVQDISAPAQPTGVTITPNP